jgi:hypothetical protein
MEDQLSKFKKNSRIGAIITAVGILIVLTAVIMLIYQNEKKDKQKDKQVAATINEIKDSVSTQVRDSVEHIARTNPSMFRRDPADHVECIADPLDEQMPNGDLLYNFTIRISDPELISRLKRVEYFFDYPDFDPKLKSSDNSERNFSVSYRGWGCLGEVPVYLHYKENEKTDTVIFPMCEKTIIKLKSQGGMRDASLNAK